MLSQWYIPRGKKHRHVQVVYVELSSLHPFWQKLKLQKSCPNVSIEGTTEDND